MEDKEYEPSVVESLKSAEAMCIALRDLGANGHQSHLWFIPAYGLGAAITVFRLYHPLSLRRALADTVRG